VEYLFYTLIGLVLYTYLGYFAVLYLWSKVAPKRYVDAGRSFEPSVSVVIAVRDEARHIEDKLLNILAQDYPKTKIEIIVVSDGSTDQTEKLIQALIERQIPKQGHSPVKLVALSQPKGKPNAINLGVASASGEIVVFADARQRFAGDAVAQLVGRFEDENVGCVSGELVFEQTPGSLIEREMGAYWKFEKKIRQMESETGSVVGASGSIYAIRRSLFQPIPRQTLLDDVLIPLQIRNQGFRVVFQNSAKAYDNPSHDFKEEKKRKIRTLAGNWQLLAMQPKLLDPFYNPLFFKFISHKVLRLLVPFALIGICLSSLSLCISVQIALVTAIVVSLAICFHESFMPRKERLLKVGAVLRAFWLLNYFAFLAPFCVLTRQKLWR